MEHKVLLIGNSDGIGLALTRQLLKEGWIASGISRSESPITDSSYQHFRSEVQQDDYSGKLKKILKQIGTPNLCLYCAGIGERLNLSMMEKELNTFEVNLIGLIKTISMVIPEMKHRGSGHFIGISSVADELLSPQAPAYHASKAAFTSYLESLALALRSSGIYISNVRFGFVDTKLAKGSHKPLMMNVEQAVRHLEKCIRKKPVRYTAPGIIIPLVKFRKWMMRLSYIS